MTTQISTQNPGTFTNELDNLAADPLDEIPQSVELLQPLISAQADKKPRQVRWRDKLARKSPKTSKAYSKHILDFIGGGRTGTFFT